MTLDEAKRNAESLGRGLVTHGIDLALADGWVPTEKEDAHEAGLEILRRGIPLLMEDLKKSGVL